MLLTRLVLNYAHEDPSILISSMTMEATQQADHVWSSSSKSKFYSFKFKTETSPRKRKIQSNVHSHNSQNLH